MPVTQARDELADLINRVRRMTCDSCRPLPTPCRSLLSTDRKVSRELPP
jgi:hypothetical protein